MNIGEIKKIENSSNGEDFIVEIIDIFDCEGVKYAEVKSVEFDSFTREVPITKLKDIE